MTWQSNPGHGPNRVFIGRRLLSLLATSAVLALILTAVVALPWRTPRVQAQTCGTSWTNASGGDWFTAGNWSAGVPTATIDACITLPGTYTVTMTGNGVAQSLTIGGGGSTPTLQILGAVCCHATLTVQSGLTNSGTITLDSLVDGRFVSLVVNTGTLTNNGTITVGASTTGARTITANLSNTASGTISINQDTLFNKSGATYTNAGTLTVAAGKTLSLFAAPTFNQSGGSLTLNGTFLILRASFVFNGGAIAGTPRFQNVALTLNTANAATFQMRGNNNTLTGDVSAAQTLNVLAESCCDAGLTAATGFINNGTITLDSLDDDRLVSLVVSTGTLTNNGTITVSASGTTDAPTIAAQLDNYGTFTVNRNATLQSSNATPINEAGAFWEVASGTLTLPQLGSPASLSNNGTLLIDPGATLAISNGSLSNSGAGGLIAGSGTIVANVSNDALVGPGSADGSTTGILTIQGSYSQTANGTLYIELCGTTAGSDYDRLAVTGSPGSAALAGTLVVTNTNPSAVCYNPQLNDSFRVLTYGSQSGNFIQPYTLPPLDPGLAWSTNLGATFLDLTVVAGAAPSGPRPSPRARLEGAPIG